MDNAANKDLGSFTGHIDDSATGLTYMQARYYDPTIVRFLSIDPVGFQVEDPYMFNRYAYVGNNPVNLTDPFGLDADDQDEKKGDEEEEEIEETEVVAEGGDDSPWLDYFIAAGLIGGDILLGGPTGEGIAPAAIILGAREAVKQTSKKAAIKLSKNGLKHLKKHLKDFQKLDPNFNLRDQIRLGRKIASNPENLVNTKNGSQAFQAVVNVGGNSITVRSVVNSSGNLRSVFPIL
ncbi:RHS repeat-associated core domain-containing protein [Exilibacterium tricleocarpae]|uniref:RHS repeat-associated core domain-containing protein n=1 Tax=Exilibacterium tricleocarpae TaxID=2591008 RepID=UPI0015D2A598|nr:RHS repeat-associated core domain-containing protein [Exilibacterium tricleocarpae]